MSAPAGAQQPPELSVPFCYGSVAWLILGKPTSPDAHSHRWTVYLRGVSGEDLSHVVSKVTFTLHPSFAEPVRTLTSPPWEVSETGWGEFEVGIAVEFAPAAGVPPLELAHGLKLHPEGPAEAAAAQQGVPVVRDRYEEFVFVAPPAALHARLAAHVPQRAAPTEVLQHVPPGYSDAEDLARFAAARTAVAQQRALLRHHGLA